MGRPGKRGCCKNFCDFASNFAFRPILCYCFSAIMYNFLKGRLVVVRIALLVAALTLVAIGIATIYSVGHPAEFSLASQTRDFEDLANNWQKQIIFAAICAVVFVAINLVNYRWFGEASYWIYGVVLVLWRSYYSAGSLICRSFH